MQQRENGVSLASVNWKKPVMSRERLNSESTKLAGKG